MQLFRVKLFVFIVFVIDYIQTELSPDGENVCLKTETYEEKIEYKKYKPKLITKKKWCWDITKKFSCEYYEPKLEIETDFRTVNRTRIVPKCCDGYKEEREKVTKCLPVCLKGCVNGECIAPEICHCFAGFYGSECEKECSEGLWGINCGNTCDCFNDGTCNKTTGVCHCKEGWTGDRCESSCQNGHYGLMCKMKCNCDNSPCHHITGECYTTTTSTTPTLPEVSTVMESTTLEASQQTKTDKTFTKVTINEVSKITEKEAIEERTTGATTDIHFPGIIELSENKEETLSTADITNEMRTTEKYIKMSNAEENETGLETSTNNIDDNEETKPTNNVNETINSSTQINLGGSEGDIDKTETDNIINENKGSSNKKTMLTMFHFLPGLSVFSSVSFLTFIIASMWLISKHRNKTRKIFKIAEKKDKLPQAEDQMRYPTENFFWSNDCTNNPVYLSDVDINRTTPVLETFKPRDKSDTETR